MENTLVEPGIPEPKSSTQIEHDMERTRESITEKVEALESQVLGTIQTATDTVTETVGAVKEAVSTAPTAVRDTLHEIVQVVKETIGSFSVSECIRNNPAAAIGATSFVGFLTGYLTGGSRGKSVAHSMSAPEPVRMQAASAPMPRTGLLNELFDRFGGEIRQLAEQTLSKAITSVKQTIEKRMPGIVDSAVERMTGGLAGANGAAPPNYGVRTPA